MVAKQVDGVGGKMSYSGNSESFGAREWAASMRVDLIRCRKRHERDVDPTDPGSRACGPATAPGPAGRRFVRRGGEGIGSLRCMAPAGRASGSRQKARGGQELWHEKQDLRGPRPDEQTPCERTVEAEMMRGTGASTSRTGPTRRDGMGSKNSSAVDTGEKPAEQNL